MELAPPQQKWSDKFAFDLALHMEGSGEPVEDILSAYGYTIDDLAAWQLDTTFTKRIDEWREEISTNGLTFKAKARAQADELLATSWGLIHDHSTPATVKADLIKSTVKWAGLEAPVKEEGGDLSGGVTIHINLDKSVTVEAETPAKAEAINITPQKNAAELPCDSETSQG